MSRKMTERDWRIAKNVWAFKTSWMDKSRSGAQLKAARQALQLTSDSVAQRLGIKEHTYLGFEKGEKSGTITLKKLFEAAEAMGCELQISIRPKLGKFSETIWDQILPHAKEIYKTKKGMPTMNGFIFASVAHELLMSVKFRSKMGWSLQKLTAQYNYAEQERNDMNE